MICYGGQCDLSKLQLLRRMKQLEFCLCQKLTQRSRSDTKDPRPFNLYYLFKVIGSIPLIFRVSLRLNRKN